MAFQTREIVGGGLLEASEHHADLTVPANRTRLTDFGVEGDLRSIDIEYSDADVRTTRVSIVRDAGLPAEVRIDLYNVTDATRRIHVETDRPLTSVDEVEVETDDVTGDWTVIVLARKGLGR